MIEKHGDFIVRQAEPFNGGPPLDRLVESHRTPAELFFVRSHAPVPRIDDETYALSVAGAVRRPLSLTLEQMRADFEHREVPATLQCAGNRRDELMAVRAIPGEVPWGAEAIGNAVWGGISLIDVLDAADPASDVEHIEFIGADTIIKGDKAFGFGGSIPIEKARDPDVLLAYEMNGAPLPPTHGAPLRVIVPGYIGARSVKWLAEVSARREPSPNYYQQRSYKLFPSDVTEETVEWANGEMLGPVGPTAVLCESVDDGSDSRLRGYAIGTEGCAVTRVEVSVDGGRSWVDAAIDAGTRGTWHLWSVRLPLPGRDPDIVVRMEDESGVVQPRSPEEIWNFKGYMNTAWHRSRISDR